MTKNDYSLLHPFDLEAAKAGAILIDTDDDQCKYIAGPHHITREVVVEFTEDLGFMTGKAADFRMAPLCWVEGRPVYKGDALYALDYVLQKVIAKGIHAAGYLSVEHESPDANVGVSQLTWTPPKVKREGWVLLHRNGSGNAVVRCSKVYDTEQEANDISDRIGEIDNVIACVRIEWEEPIGGAK